MEGKSCDQNNYGSCFCGETAVENNAEDAKEGTGLPLTAPPDLGAVEPELGEHPAPRWGAAVWVRHVRSKVRLDVCGRLCIEALAMAMGEEREG